MNNVITNKRFSPQRAIIVYKDGANYSPNYYLESLEIKSEKGKYQFMAPVPLAENVMKQIAKSYVRNNAVEMSFGSIIPDHILNASNRDGFTAVMWYRPAMTKNLNFSSSLNIKGDSSVQVPAILYLVLSKKLYLFALMDSSRPELKTKLYNAPFFNIYEDGNVCLGSAVVGQRTNYYEKDAERFERAFFMAEQNGGQSRYSCKTDLGKLWGQLIKKKGPFPSKQELIQHKKFKTVGELMNKLISKNFDYDEED